MGNKNKVIIIQLNELNFDLLERYVSKIDLKNFKKILSLKRVTTQSEHRYELLEPWIQWYSFYTGKKAEEHGVTRLGDAVKTPADNFLNDLERRGFSIGCVSPMNLANNFLSPKYFIPDPWTQTLADPSFISTILHKLIVQTVNDNSQGRISMLSVLSLVYAFLFYIPITGKLDLINLAFQAVRKRYMKAVFLDRFLIGIFCALQSKRRADISVLFLNSLAHLQHHYMHNSLALDTQANPDWLVSKNLDPIQDGLIEMDKCLGVILQLASKTNSNVLFATGLSQVPFTKKKFYYRLKDHHKFLDFFKINYCEIFPRMTRDFEVTFSNENDRDLAFAKINKIHINEEKAFGEIEKRPNSLFLTLTVDFEIKKQDQFYDTDRYINAFEAVAFVALKNGHHCAKGWLIHDFDESDIFFEGINVADIACGIKRSLTATGG